MVKQTASLEDYIQSGKNKCIGMALKVRLHEASVMSTMLSSVQSWTPVSYLREKLEAAHHKFHRRILGIIWKDSQEKGNQNIDKTGIDWPNYKGKKTETARSLILRQALHWELDTAKWKPGRTRKNSKDNIHQMVEDTDTTWEGSTATSCWQERMASKKRTWITHER